MCSYIAENLTINAKLLYIALYTNIMLKRHTTCMYIHTFISNFVKPCSCRVTVTEAEILPVLVRSSTLHVYTPLSLYESLFICNTVTSVLAFRRESSMDVRPANCDDMSSIGAPSNSQLIFNAVVFCSILHANKADCRCGRSPLDLIMIPSTAVTIVAAATVHVTSIERENVRVYKLYVNQTKYTLTELNIQ